MNDRKVNIPPFTPPPRVPRPGRKRLRHSRSARYLPRKASAPRIRSARAHKPHFPREGQVGHLAVYERRASHVDLGLQAGTDQTRWPGAEADKNTGFFTDRGAFDEVAFQVCSAWQSGSWVPALSEHGEHVDKMAFLHSCWTDSNNHSPALFKVNTAWRMGFRASARG